MPSDSSPLPQLPYGPGRTSNPPLRTRHDTPDHGGEAQFGQPQRAGVHTLDPVDASAAAPDRSLLPPSGPPAARSTLCTTSAALRDPLPGPRSGSIDQEPTPVNVSAHDADPLSFTDTLYVPYVERPELPDSVPKFPQPSSSDRPSSPRSPRPEGLGNVDASVPLRPPGTVLSGTRDAAPIVQGTCDASLYGTSSCAVEPRPAEVSFLSGTPAVDANASENDCRPLSAQAPRARYGASLAPNAMDIAQSGTICCPDQAVGRESV